MHKLKTLTELRGKNYLKTCASLRAKRNRASQTLRKLWCKLRLYITQAPTTVITADHMIIQVTLFTTVSYPATVSSLFSTIQTWISIFHKRHSCTHHILLPILEDAIDTHPWPSLIDKLALLQPLHLQLILFLTFHTTSNLIIPSKPTFLFQPI